MQSESQTPFRKTAAVDFDGVLNTYTKWTGHDDLHEPRPGAREFLEALSKTHDVVIYSTRRPMAIELWLREHNMWQFVKEVSNKKPLAVVYIDDRALGFNGDYNQTLEAVASFRPWYQRAEENPRPGQGK